MEQNIENQSRNMKREIVSKIAANSSLYLYAEVPSRYVPFQGEFPLIKEYQRQRFEAELYSKMWLDECSLWFQEAVMRARKMEIIDNGFKKFLDDLGILHDFENLKESEKDFMLEIYMKNIGITRTDLICRLISK